MGAARPVARVAGVEGVTVSGRGLLGEGLAPRVRSGDRGSGLPRDALVQGAKLLEG